MISGISSKNWIVFKSAWKRLKWLSILYGVAVFLELPMAIWMQLARQKAFQGDAWAQLTNKTNLSQYLFNPIEHFTNIAVPVIFGLILFNYLQNDRASTFLHSLPIRRRLLYFQNLLAGLSLIWLPLLINGLLLYGIFAAFGVVRGEWLNPLPSMELAVNSGPVIVSLLQALTNWLLLSLLMASFCYIFTVFIGMLTGSILLQGALTFIGFFLPTGVYVLMKENFGRLLYGYPKGISQNTAEYLSPVMGYLDQQGFLSPVSGMYLWYLAAVLIICGVSIYLYKTRHVEAAGETLAAEWIRQVFKYGAAICAALVGGVYFSALNDTNTGLYLGYFIGAVLGYIIADMIAYKSFHFYERWKGMVVFAAVFVLLFFSVNMDFYGYQKYIPDQNEIKEVSLSILNRDGYPEPEALSGQNEIRLVRELHQEIIKSEQENKAREISFRQQAGRNLGASEPYSMVTAMDITYLLDNGKKIKRSYNIDVFHYRRYLYPIVNSPGAKRIMFSRLFKLDEKKIDQININNNHLGKSIRVYKPTEIKEALDALRKDVLNTPYEAVIEGQIPAQAMIDFVPKVENNRGYTTYSLPYYGEYANFKAFLETHGYSGELFLKPAELSSIVVKKVGSTKTVELKDGKMMEELLNLCSAEDQGSFLMKQQQPAGKDMVQYYGKIVKKNGSPIYVAFDGSQYAQKLLHRIMGE